ncbi:MAG: oxygen-independent coproporphyrinogen III oxidase [Wenzhouxiangellaceae bacterium]
MPAALRPQFDPTLIGKYGGPGPRYTSYPTALQFHEAYGPENLLAALDASNQPPIPADLSLYVHVPFCTSPCFYCGCNRIITRSTTAGGVFLDDLERELEIIAPHVDPDRTVRQIHLGGGTPTFLSPTQIHRLIDTIDRRFRIDRDAEISLEVDPRSVDPDTIATLRRIAFNRISIGVQDLSPEVQKAVNRIHDEHQVRTIVEAARAAGFLSINLDLILGLPRQTPERFARTVERIIAMRPARLSLFNYAHLPHRFKAQKQIRIEDLPSPEAKLAMFSDTLERLLDAGYEYIGMDHFALPDDELAVARREGKLVRNFQGYTTGAGLDLIGFGPSAISQIGDHFAQNRHHLIDWQQAVRGGRPATARGLVRNDDDRVRADIIAQIMCTGGLDWRTIERDWSLDFAESFATELERLETIAADGLIEWHDHGFRATATGQLFLRAIAMVFDAWLNTSDRAVAGHSRVI